jgi:hypothetical protein
VHYENVVARSKKVVSHVVVSMRARPSCSFLILMMHLFKWYLKIVKSVYKS